MKRNLDLLKFVCPMVLVLLSVLNIGTIRKKDDPILKTQTDPILYKEKMEEIKDGEKGAPEPAWRLYPKAKFNTETPMKVGREIQEESKTQGEERIPELGEPIPENLEGIEQEQRPGEEQAVPAESKSSNEDGWWTEDEQKTEEAEAQDSGAKSTSGEEFSFEEENSKKTSEDKILSAYAEDPSQSRK